VHADTAAPTVNGLFYGDGDDGRYVLIGESARGSKLYAYMDGTTYYSALVVDRNVKDNVHGNLAYTDSAGWNPPHEFRRLTDSEFMGFTLTCGTTSWTWRQGYADQPDDPKNNTNPTWFSDETAGAGEGTPPPGHESSSSLVWNMNNYASGGTPGWDVTVGGTLSFNDWKSPFDEDFPDDVTKVDGYPASGDITYSSTYGWEWAMVYEWSADLTDCGSEPIRISETSSHHSPAKSGGEDDPIIDPQSLYDWGDLPATYATLDTANGARHEIVASGAFLGALHPDAEGDGAASASADGDDDKSANDEDGIVFLTPLVPGSTAQIQVTAGTSGNLSAWIDFDGDGTLDQVTITAAVGPATVETGTLSDTRLDVPGVYTFTIEVPNTATGVMYSRWRFTNESGQGGASVTGVATTGEVEDYALASVGNYIWRDLDGDGVQDETASEGVNGVVVRLLDAAGDPVLDGDGNAITTTTTNDADGNPGYYLFSGLLPGVEYRIGVDEPEGFVLTSQDADGLGISSDDNSDAAPSTGLTDTFTLGAGDAVTTVDAGLAVRDLEITLQCGDYEGTSPFVVAIDRIAHTGDSVLDATGVTLEHTFGAGVTYHGFNVLEAPAGSTTTLVEVVGQTVTLALSSALQPGEVWRVELLVTWDGGSQTTVSNLAAVSLNEAETDADNNEDACGSTVPVSLAFFRAEPTDSGVRFAWSTATEAGNAGFHIYADGPDGVERLTEVLVPSQAIDSHVPLDYEIDIEEVDARVFYIDDIDIFGRAQRRGPYNLGRSYGQRPEVEQIDWSVIRAQSEAAAESRAHAELTENTARIESLMVDLGVRDAALDSGSQPAIRNRGTHAGRLMLPGSFAGAGAGTADSFGATGGPISGRPPTGREVVAQLRVDQTGIVRVTYEQLAAAGVDLSGVSPAYLGLLNRGEPVPLRVSGPFRKGAFIEFYAEALDTIYTDTNVYRLVIGNGVQRAWPAGLPVAGKSVPPPTWYWEMREVERQLRYYFGARGDDPWMDTFLLARPGQPAGAAFDIEIDRLVTDVAAATLRVEIMGGTDWPAAPDHRVLVELNGVQVAEEVFDGLVAVPIEVSLPPGLLVEGTNSLRVVAPGDTGVAGEVVWIDRFSIEYPREIIARDGGLELEAMGKRISVAGLTDPDVAVYRIEDGVGFREANVKVKRQGGAYTATFPGTGQSRVYAVAGADSLVPVEVSAASAKVDISSTPAEYVMISHPDFIPELERLAALRRSEGLSVSIVDVRDIYQQFGHGIFDPSAIRDYIRFASANLGTRYVLLGGGDAYDYRDYTGAGSLSFVPSLYAATDFIVRHAPVDPLFADVDGDEVPDLAIGRMPARTPAEMATLVDKTIEYGTKDYTRTAVFAADKDDRLGAFTRYSEVFASGLPTGWEAARAHMQDQGKAGARQTLIEALNRGVALTSFIGHSSPTMWSFDRLFTSGDAASLTNSGRPTVVTQWGCWNTYYVSPSANTLAHRFLLSGDQGAAAVLGASTLTLTTSEVRLGSMLTPRIVEDGKRLGDAVLEAKQQLGREQPGLIDVQLGWVLLGDPTIVVESSGD